MGKKGHPFGLVEVLGEPFPKKGKKGATRQLGFNEEDQHESSTSLEDCLMKGTDMTRQLFRNSFKVENYMSHQESS